MLYLFMSTDISALRFTLLPLTCHLMPFGLMFAFEKR